MNSKNVSKYSPPKKGTSFTKVSASSKEKNLAYGKASAIRRDRSKVSLCDVMDELKNHCQILNKLGQALNKGLGCIEKAITEQGDKIMSKVSDFAAKQNAHNDKLDKAIDGLTADVTEMKRLIDELQNSPGEISPEDQASLDALDARGAAAVAKAEALDALTPPATTDLPPTDQPA